jgi:hypothetical protein
MRRDTAVRRLTTIAEDCQRLSYRRGARAEPVELAVGADR